MEQNSCQSERNISYLEQNTGQLGQTSAHSKRNLVLWVVNDVQSGRNIDQFGQKGGEPGRNINHLE